MSFRVKQTHQLLQTSTTASAPESVPTFVPQKFTGLFDRSKYYTMPAPVRPSKPGSGSGQGLAIRTVTSCQADHM